MIKKSDLYGVDDQKNTLEAVDPFGGGGTYDHTWIPIDPYCLEECPTPTLTPTETGSPTATDSNTLSETSSSTESLTNSDTESPTSSNTESETTSDTESFTDSNTISGTSSETSSETDTQTSDYPDGVWIPTDPFCILDTAYQGGGSGSTFDPPCEPARKLTGNIRCDGEDLYVEYHDGFCNTYWEFVNSNSDVCCKEDENDVQAWIPIDPYCMIIPDSPCPQGYIREWCEGDDLYVEYHDGNCGTRIQIYPDSEEACCPESIWSCNEWECETTGGDEYARSMSHARRFYDEGRIVEWDKDQPTTFYAHFNRSGAGTIDMFYSTIYDQGLGISIWRNIVRVIKFKKSLTNRYIFDQDYTSQFGHNLIGWHQIHITDDGLCTKDSIKIYIDGILLTGAITYRNNLSGSIINGQGRFRLFNTDIYDNRLGSFFGCVAELGFTDYVKPISEINQDLSNFTMGADSGNMLLKVRMTYKPDGSGTIPNVGDGLTYNALYPSSLIMTQHYSFSPELPVIGDPGSFCLLPEAATTVENTGTKICTELVEVDGATGDVIQVVPNDSDHPFYVAPVEDLTLCPTENDPCEDPPTYIGKAYSRSGTVICNEEFNAVEVTVDVFDLYYDPCTEQYSCQPTQQKTAFQYSCSNNVWMYGENIQNPVDCSNQTWTPDSDTELEVNTCCSKVYAEHFDGVNDFHYGNFTEFDRNQAWTFAAWVKHEGSGSNAIYSSRKLSIGQRGFSITVGGTGELIVLLRNDLASNNILVETTSVLTSGWHFIQVTYDGSSSASGISIRVDNVNQSLNIVFNNLTDTIVNGQNKFTLGRLFIDGSSITSYWQGAIALVSFVDYVKSAAELTADYNNRTQSQGSGNYLLHVEPQYAVNGSKPITNLSASASYPYTGGSNITRYGEANPILDLNTDFKLLP